MRDINKQIISGDKNDICSALKSPQLYVYDKATFFDFDQYQETAYKWKLDFRLMSKGGFNATRTSLIVDKVIINLSQFGAGVI